MQFSEGSTHNESVLSILRDSRMSVEKVCGDATDNQDYLRYDMNFVHNSTTDPIHFQVWTNNTSNSSWGVKQFMVLARKCNSSCDACFGPSNTQCYSCVSSFILTNTTCSCNEGLGPDAFFGACVACAQAHCRKCFTSYLNCQECATGYGLNNFGICLPCFDTHCLACSSNYSVCTQCMTGSIFINSTTCMLCQPQCSACSGSTDFCQSCTLTGPHRAYLLGNTCHLKCPDYTYGQTVTTGTTRNLCLACSPDCISCSGNPTPCTRCQLGYWLHESACLSSCPPSYVADNYTQTCLLQEELGQIVYSRVRKLGCNACQFILQFQSTANVDTAEIMNNDFIITKMSAVQNILTLQASYSRNFIDQQLVLRFNRTKLFKIEPRQYLPLFLCTKQQQQLSLQSQNILKAVIYASYSVLLASLFVSKLIGLQLFGVLQLAYFSLHTDTYWNIYMEVFNKFKIVNGISINLRSQAINSLPAVTKQMQISSNFLNNMNLMFILPVTLILIGGSLLIAAEVSNSHKLRCMASVLLNQWLVAVVMFVILSLFCYAGVHLRHTSNANPMQTMGTAFLALCLLIVGLAFVATLGLNSIFLGQFSLLFKDTQVCQLYMVLSFCFRMVAGFAIGFIQGSGYSTLALVCLSLGFLLFTSINLPFKSFYHNYRAVVINLTLSLISILGNYRRMNEYSPASSQQIARDPTIFLVLLSMILLCLLVSALVLCYQIYMAIVLVCRYRTRRVSDKYGQEESRASIGMGINYTEEDINGKTAKGH